MGKSVRAARELTVSGYVVVPGRMARGPRGAAELQEKCQIVEGAQRRGQRGPHAARSGRGAPPPHIGAPQPAEPAPALSYQAPPPPSPAGPGPAPAAGSERTPSPPPPTAGLFACAEGHSVPPRTRPPPRSPPRAGGGGGIRSLIYHQSFAQAGIFKAVLATGLPRGSGCGAGLGAGGHLGARPPAGRNPRVLGAEI